VKQTLSHPMFPDGHINGDRLGKPVTTNRFRQKPQCGVSIPVLHEQKVDGLAVLVHRMMQIPPLPPPLNGVSSIRQLPHTGRLRWWNASSIWGAYFSAQRFIVE
jgi:hypothetical protein